MARINLYVVSFDLSYKKGGIGLQVSDVKWRTRSGKHTVRPQASPNQIPRNSDVNPPVKKRIWDRLVTRRKSQPKIIEKTKQEPVLDLQSLNNHSAEVSGQLHLEAKIKGFLTSTSSDYAEVAEEIQRLHNLFPDSEEYLNNYFAKRYSGEERNFRAGFAKAMMLVEQGREGEGRKLFGELQAEMDKDMFTGMNPEKVAMVQFLEGRFEKLNAERQQKRAAALSSQTATEQPVTEAVPEPEVLDFSGTPDELRGRAKALVDQEDFASAEQLLNHLIALPPEEDNDRRSSHVLNAYRMGKQAQSGKFLGTASPAALREHRELMLDYQSRGYWFDVQVDGLKKLEATIKGLSP